MGRVLAIVGLVALSMVTGVAGASPTDQVRLPVTVGAEPDEGSEPEVVTVVEGDHLWKISARQLGPKAPSEQIAPYWRDVVAVNTPNLRSGDPDLIYPGEVVEMPAIP